MLSKKFLQSNQDAVKKNSTLKLQILQIFTAKFNTYLKFTWNIFKVSDILRSGKKLLTRGRSEVGTRVRLFFCKQFVEGREKKCQR